eukprot:scaffold3158_cov389-Prasinococcus_capsulatus_cf.AAC.9
MHSRRRLIGRGCIRPCARSAAAAHRAGARGGTAGRARNGGATVRVLERRAAGARAGRGTRGRPGVALVCSLLLAPDTAPPARAHWVPRPASRGLASKWWYSFPRRKLCAARLLRGCCAGRLDLCGGNTPRAEQWLVASVVGPHQVASLRHRQVPW